MQKKSSSKKDDDPFQPIKPSEKKKTLSLSPDCPDNDTKKGKEKYKEEWITLDYEN